MEELGNKDYTIEFYVGKVGADGDGGSIPSMLHTISKKHRGPAITLKGMTYQIRDLKEYEGGASYRGVFAKFRDSDIPHAGSPAGSERELELSDDEGLIEKNYFNYFSENDLLVFQRNGHGSTSNRFSEYFSDLANDTVVFDPVLQAEPTRRLLRGAVHPKSIEVSFSRPTNPDMFPSDDWNRSILDALTAAGGIRMHLRISSDGRSSTAADRMLATRIKRGIAALVDSGCASVAKVQVEEDGRIHPIDLIADRLLSVQNVAIKGRYPIPDSMYAALRNARSEHRNELKEIFGVRGRAIS